MIRAAEVEHLLRLGEAADERSGEAFAAKDQAKGRYGHRFVRCADERERAIGDEEIEVGVDVVIGGDGVEDEVKAANVLLHLVRVASEDDFIGTEAQRVVFFAGGGGEHDGVGTEGMCEFHAHVPEATETDHADFFALHIAPTADG